MQGTVSSPDGKIRAQRTKDVRVQSQEIVALARELKVQGEATQARVMDMLGKVEY